MAPSTKFACTLPGRHWYCPIMLIEWSRRGGPFGKQICWNKFRKMFQDWLFKCLPAFSESVSLWRDLFDLLELKNTEKTGSFWMNCLTRVWINWLGRSVKKIPHPMHLDLSSLKYETGGFVTDGRLSIWMPKIQVLLQSLKFRPKSRPQKRVFE